MSKVLKRTLLKREPREPLKKVKHSHKCIHTRVMFLVYSLLDILIYWLV